MCDTRRWALTRSPTIRLGLGILLLCGAPAARAAAAGPCDGGDAALNETIGAALGAWSSANRVVYEKARGEALRCLADTRAVLSPETIAAWFRFQAVDALYQRGDVPEARRSLAASVYVDAAFSWERSVLATNTDLPPMLVEARRLSVGAPVPLRQEDAVRTYVNGEMADVRPANLPVLLQVEAPGIGVIQTLVLSPGQDWSPDDIASYELVLSSHDHRIRYARTAMISGGALLALACVVEGGAVLGGELMRARSDAPDAARDALLLSAGGQIGAALVAGSGLTAVVVGARMRW